MFVRITNAFALKISVRPLIAVAVSRFLFLLLIGLVMTVFLLQFPHILMRILHVVVTHLLQNFLQITDWLPRHLHQVFDIVVLMLLECIEQHVQHSVLIITSLFAFVLFTFLVFNVVFVIGYWFVILYDFV